MQRLSKFLLLVLCQTAAAAEHLIEIEVTNVTPDRSVVNVAVHDSDATYLSRDVEPFRARSIASESGRLTVAFDGLAPGRYAVTIYQDLNGNGDLDSNLFGMPNEPFGFSNNPRMFFGPPSFKKAAFEVSEDLSIEVKLR